MFFILFTFALLASAISVNKIILFTMTPSLLVAIRMFFGSLILFFYNYLSGQKLLWSQIRNYLILLLVVTVCTTYLPSTLKAYGLKEMVSSKAAFLGALDPFITPVFGYFFFAEKLTLKKVLGIFLGFIGASILIISKSGQDELKAFAFFSYPEIAYLLAIIISRFGWTLIQKSLKQKLYTPAQINAITMLISGIFSFATTIFFYDFTIGSLSNAPFTILKLVPFKYISSEIVLIFFIFYTILVGNVLSYTFYAHVLKQYSANFVAIVGFSIPIYVHFYGWLFLSEQLSLEFFVSCAITFLGLLIFFREEKKFLQKQENIGV